MEGKDSKGRFTKGHKSFWSDETRKKMSDTAKKRGFGKWMLGRKLPEEVKKRIKENFAKYWLGKERPSMKGKSFLSVEGRERIRQSQLKNNSMKGKIPWNKDKQSSLATRKKMSEAMKKSYAQGRIHHFLGKKRPDFAGENNPLWGKFGKEHPKWNDVKNRPFYKSIREIFKYVEWRKSVFAQDNFTCRLCGISGVYVEADHFPKRFIDIVRDNDIQDIGDAIKCDELWDVGNGRTLCSPCHRKTDTWGNTKGLKKTNQNGLTD